MEVLCFQLSIRKVLSHQLKFQPTSLLAVNSADLGTAII